MSNTSGTMRETVRETVKDAKDAARESGKAASAASGDIQADLEALRSDVVRLGNQIADIFASKGGVAWSRARSNVEGVMSDVGAKGPQELGKVMKPAMEKLRGKAEGARVQQLLRELLGG